MPFRGGGGIGSSWKVNVISLPFSCLLVSQLLSSAPRSRHPASASAPAPMAPRDQKSHCGAVGLFFSDNVATSNKKSHASPLPQQGKQSLPQPGCLPPGTHTDEAGARGPRGALGFVGLKGQGPESGNNNNPVWHLVRSRDQGEGLTWKGCAPAGASSHLWDRPSAWGLGRV